MKRGFFDSLVQRMRFVTSTVSLVLVPIFSKARTEKEVQEM